jgi:hypothetical protein
VKSQITTNEQAMRQQLVKYQKVYNTRMAWAIWAKEEGFNISYFNTLDGIVGGLSHTMKVKEIDRNVN